MVPRNHTSQRRDSNTASAINTSSAHAEAGTAPNLHSRAVARERLRRQQQQQQQQQQQSSGGVIADLNSLHSQQNKDIHTLFTPTPHDTIPASVYVSGHLSPADQWVAVASESSGVISLTESDAEDDGADSVPDYKGKGKQASASYSHTLDNRKEGFDVPADLHYYHHTSSSEQHFSALDNTPSTSHNATDTDQQTMHLLRESVASLLSAANSPSSSSVSSNRQHQLLQSASTSGRRDRRRLHSSHYGRSQSPSNLSKISEPCYLSSASHQRVTADLDHFSDIALSSYAMTAPPSHQQKHTAASASRFRPPPPAFPPYEEFKQQKLHSNAAASQWSEMSDHLAPETGSAMSVPAASAIEPQASQHQQNTPLVGTLPGDCSTAVNSSAPAHTHHSPADYGLHYRGIRNVSLSNASRSPFASIRTVSPVLISQRSPMLDMGSPLDPDAVSRAQAEAALEQTILCPLSRTIDNAGYSRLASSKRVDAASVGASGDGDGNNARQNWAKYTGYAIVGFGVGTLVGMMCFDIAANSTPRATRTLPIATV